MQKSIVYIYYHSQNKKTRTITDRFCRNSWKVLELYQLLDRCVRFYSWSNSTLQSDFDCIAHHKPNSDSVLEIYDNFCLQTMMSNRAGADSVSSTSHIPIMHPGPQLPIIVDGQKSPVEILHQSMNSFQLLDLPSIHSYLT